MNRERKVRAGITALHGLGGKGLAKNSEPTAHAQELGGGVGGLGGAIPRKDGREGTQEEKALTSKKECMRKEKRRKGKGRDLKKEGP